MKKLALKNLPNNVEVFLAHKSEAGHGSKYEVRYWGKPIGHITKIITGYGTEYVFPGAIFNYKTLTLAAKQLFTNKVILAA